jgi:hypothetical protein
MSHKQKRHLRCTVALVLLAVVPFLMAAKPTEFHVATTGNDEDPGTAAKPFATLEGARDAIRESGVAGKTTCTVWLHGGIHRRKQTFAIEEQDSGTRDHPIIYRGVKGETARLIGGTVLKPDAFTLVNDQALLERIPETARGKVYMLDLAAQGIKHTTPYPDKFTDNGGIFELFFDSKRMPVSIYPNKHGAMTIKRVVVNGGGQEKPGSWRVYYGEGTPEQRRALESGEGPRPGVFEYGPEHAGAHAQWAKVLNRGVWLKGYWRVVWQNETVRVGAIDTEKQTVTLAVPVSHGIGSKYHRPDGSGEEIYWVMNLLEAVDQPGEWAVDFQDKKLFFYPPGPLADADILVSDMESPIVEARDSHHTSSSETSPLKEHWATASVSSTVAKSLFAVARSATSPSTASLSKVARATSSRVATSMHSEPAVSGYLAETLDRSRAYRRGIASRTAISTTSARSSAFTRPV